MSNLIQDLDSIVGASTETGSFGDKDFSPIPKGTYNLKLIGVEDWKPRTLKNVKVISFNDHFQKVKGPDGEDVITLVPSLTIHENNLKFEVIDGTHKGRWIFNKVSTHPNRPWEIPNMLAGFGVPQIKLSNLASLKDSVVSANVDISSWDKPMTDSETGIEKTVKSFFNKITRFNKASGDSDDMNV